MTIYIYTLSHPETMEIRYVGKTNNLTTRYRDHLITKNKRTHTNNWIKSLQAQGLKPYIKVIEECTLDGWEEREIYWINYYKNVGYDLTNMTKGGEGSYGHKQYEVTDRIRIIRSTVHKNKTLSEETRQLISTSLTGKKQSVYTVNKRSISNSKTREERSTILLHIFQIHGRKYIGSSKTAKQAAKIIGCGISSVLNHISGRSKYIRNHFIHRINCI